jgi:hypothetical protein
MTPRPPNFIRSLATIFFVFVAFGASNYPANAQPAAPVTAAPAIQGYADYEALAAQVHALAHTPDVKVSSLAKTLGHREVFLVTIGTGDVHHKPAILFLGNVHAPHLVGSELAMRAAASLARKAQDDAETKSLLRRYTFYFIPRPSPDASEAFFHRPHVEQPLNDRPTDDDRDGEVNEDPTEDLNGDGWITQMRVADESGTYRSHSGDPRVLIQADAKKNEKGRYRLYSEGTDNDQDEEFNEDGPGGVAFNRNFPFRYPFFKVGAGPHQVSENETRAVADFCFAHPNIAAVFCFSPEDNLMHPWKPDTGAEGQRIKTTVLSGDAPWFDYVAGEYQKIHGGKDAPDSPKGEGSFSEWAYFHLGCWSFAARGWWIPQVPAANGKPKENDKPKEGQPSKSEPAKDKAGGKPSEPAKPSDDKRGAEELNALRWFNEQKIEGFVPWTPIQHPDFPGKKVEVGGFKPFLLLNPPAKELDALADKHLAFLVRLAKLLPRARIHETKVDSLGRGVYRVTATVLNEGYLPTVSEMGKTNGVPQPLQIKIELPAGATLVEGPGRVRLERLAGNGGKAQHAWLVLVEKGEAARIGLTVWSPAVGSHSVSLELRSK